MHTNEHKKNKADVGKPGYILACDFDGTLFRHDGRGFLLQDLEAIKRFRTEGGLIGLNTGRGLKAFEPDLVGGNAHLYDEYAFDFLGGSSGAEIADKNGVLFDHHTFSPELLETLQNEFGDDVQFACVDGAYHRRNNYINEFPISGGGFEDLREFKDRDVTSLAIVFEGAGGAARKERVHRKLEQIDLPITWFENLESIDIVPAPCSKAYCLEELSRYFGVPMEHVYGIGDGLNDLPALKAGAAGFAIAAGDENLKAQADYVVEDVAEAIEIIEKLENLKEPKSNITSAGQQQNLQ